MWTATNPGVTPYIGFDVFNDVRAFATPNLICGTVPGDTNGDGAVNGRDVANYTKCMLGILSGSFCGCSDMNFDDAVTPDDTPIFVAALLGTSQVYSASFGPMPITITTDAGVQNAMAEGEIRLGVGPPNRQGVRPVGVDELIFGISSVPTMGGPTGGVSVLVDLGSGTGTWNLESGQFQLAADFNVGYPLIAQNEPHQPPQGPANDTRQLPTEFWDGFLTATAALGQGVQSVELNGEATLDVIESITGRLSRITAPIEGLAVSTRPIDLIPCPEERKCRKRRVCQQPVFVRNTDGSNPAGSSFASFRAAADALWERCCVEFDWQPPTFVDNTALKVIENADQQAGLDEQIMLLSKFDANGENDCIEIFFVEQFLTSGGQPHENGDGISFCGGMKANQIIVADDAVDNCNPPRTLVLAHEVGHGLGLDTMDSNGDGDEHESGCVMMATGNPPNCPGQTPNKVSLMQCKALRNPLLKKVMPEQECCKNPNCP